MVLHKVDVQKTLGSEFWTNVYYVDAANLDAAATAAELIVIAERQIHLDTVLFDFVRVSQADSGESYRTIPFNVYGARGSGSSGHLPLFCVFRVDLSTGSGRPSRKYVRGPILEDDQINGNLTSATITALTSGSSYIGLLGGVDALRDVDGEPFTDITLFPKVGMRQLRRGSKRKATPVI